MVDSTNRAKYWNNATEHDLTDGSKGADGTGFMYWITTYMSPDMKQTGKTM